MTSLQRFSAMNIASPWRGLNVIPSASVPAGERQAAMFLYAGIAVTQDAIRNFSLREWRKWRKPEDERDLKALGIAPAAAEVVARVVERQVKDLHLDEQQRLEELTRELELDGVQWDSRYLDLLNSQREMLIGQEIGQILRQKADLQSQEEASILLLLMTL